MFTLNGTQHGFVVGAEKKPNKKKKQRNINKAAAFSYCRLMFSDTMGAPTFAFLPTEEV